MKVDKNIPIPESRSKYPYKELEIGDSFKTIASKRSGALASCKAWGDRQNPEWKFASRLINDTEVRIWRIS